MSGERVRYQQTGEFHFLTFSCYHRRAYLSPAATKELFEDALERVRLRYLFVVAAYVVMPEHVHLLVNEPRRALLSRAVQALKFSMRSSQRPFWQAHYQSVFHICRSGFGRFPETRFDCVSHPWRFRIFLIYETRSMTSTSSHTRSLSKSCATSIAIPSDTNCKTRAIKPPQPVKDVRRQTVKDVLALDSEGPGAPAPSGPSSSASHPFPGSWPRANRVISLQDLK